MSQSTPDLSRRIQVVDLFRTFSILSVLALHLRLAQIIPLPTDFLSALSGIQGVSMFFVISGFLISRLIAAGPGGLYQPDFRDFYSRRFGRLFPLLALDCLFGILLIASVKTPTPAFDLCIKNPNLDLGPALWLSIVTFSSNWYKIWMEYRHQLPELGLHFGVLWSLAVEEQFYLFYPFLLEKLKNQKNMVPLLMATILLGPLSIVGGLVLMPHHNLGQFSSFLGFSLIAMGCLLYLTLERFKGYLLQNPAVSVSLCVAGFVLLFVTSRHVYGHQDPWVIFAQSVTGLGTCLFLLGGMTLNFFESRWLAPFCFPGKLSYGMYLMHGAILYFCWPLLAGQRDIWAFLIFAAVTVMVAFISFRFFEEPLNRWIRSRFKKTAK